MMHGRGFLKKKTERVIAQDVGGRDERVVSHL